MMLSKRLLIVAVSVLVASTAMANVDYLDNRQTSYRPYRSSSDRYNGQSRYKQPSYNNRYSPSNYGPSNNYGSYGNHPYGKTDSYTSDYSDDKCCNTFRTQSVLETFSVDSCQDAGKDLVNMIGTDVKSVLSPSVRISKDTVVVDGIVCKKLTCGCCDSLYVSFWNAGSAPPPPPPPPPAFHNEKYEEPTSEEATKDIRKKKNVSTSPAYTRLKAEAYVCCINGHNTNGHTTNGHTYTPTLIWDSIDHNSRDFTSKIGQIKYQSVSCVSKD